MHKAKSSFVHAIKLTLPMVYGEQKGDVGDYLITVQTGQVLIVPKAIFEALYYEEKNSYGDYRNL